LPGILFVSRILLWFPNLALFPESCPGLSLLFCSSFLFLSFVLFFLLSVSFPFIHFFISFSLFIPFLLFVSCLYFLKLKRVRGIFSFILFTFALK